eukprot:9477045-Pyramimonas_sp.AAC.1
MGMNWPGCHPDLALFEGGGVCMTACPASSSKRPPLVDIGGHRSAPPTDQKQLAMRSSRDGNTRGQGDGSDGSSGVRTSARPRHFPLGPPRAQGGHRRHGWIRV